MNEKKNIDFAISYAGEDKPVAIEIAKRLRELRFTVFCAADYQYLLVGVDGESFFERMFSEATEVIALISKNYRRKEWPSFEWDIVRRRQNVHRFIPIRLDDTQILGLPSNIIYLKLSHANYDRVVATCISRLLLYEQAVGISRPSEYEQILAAIKNNSNGALEKAFQLVVDKRERTPLDDCEVPTGPHRPCYRLADVEWSNFAVAKRRSVKIIVPAGLSLDALRFNLEHCAATQFNACKPDAVMVLAYFETDENNTDTAGIFTAGRAIFAPFGDWTNALDRVAYNLPTSVFRFSIDLASGYFLDQQK